MLVPASVHKISVPERCPHQPVSSLLLPLTLRILSFSSGPCFINVTTSFPGGMKKLRLPDIMSCILQEHQPGGPHIAHPSNNGEWKSVLGARTVRTESRPVGGWVTKLFSWKSP